MSTEKKYNLLYEPWIMAIDDSEETQKLSLLDVLKDAHKYKRLSGELPTQDIAILRLLLAVIYAVFTKFDSGGKPLTWAKEKPFADLREALRHWQSLWERGLFPYEIIERYLKSHEERFYLFHPETPFFQVANVKTADGKISAATQIITDVPSRIERRFFSNRLGKNIGKLEYDEAARWLVNLHAWDYAGKKNAIVGGSKDGGGTGWLGKLGVIYLTGNNLFETLMLNLGFADSNGLIEIGSPAWEQEPRTAAKREVMPKGCVDLLTWQSRRTLLFEEDNLVTGVLVSYGDVFDKENTFVEQMSAWHKSSEKSAEGKFIPNTLKKERSMWRDLGALLPLSISENSNTRMPGVLSWRGHLNYYEIIDNENVNVSAIGAEYGAMMGIINELIEDRINFNAKLLTEFWQEWVPEILNALEKTDRCVQALGYFARNLAMSAGADEKDKMLDTAANSAKANAYFELDDPFRFWLASINPGEDSMSDRYGEWIENMRETILHMGEAMAGDAGDKVYVGKSYEINAPNKYSLFRGSIFKIVPNKKKKGGQNV